MRVKADILAMRFLNLQPAFGLTGLAMLYGWPRLAFNIFVLLLEGGLEPMVEITVIAAQYSSISLSQACT